MSADTAAQYHLDEFGLEFPNGADPTFDALMATVLDSGGDATAYLVLADWLDENGRHSEALAHRLRAIDPTWEVFIDIEVDDVSITKPKLTLDMLARIRKAIPSTQGSFFVRPTAAILKAMQDWPWPFGVDVEKRSVPVLLRWLDRLPNLQTIKSFESLLVREFDAITAHEPLRRLELPGQAPTEKHFPKLARLSKLTALDLATTKLASADWGALSELEHLTTLNIQHGEKVRLTGLDQLPALRSLTLGCTSMDPKAIRVLGKLKALKKLKFEGIDKCPKVMPTVATLPELESLDFFWCDGLREKFAPIEANTKLREFRCIGQKIDEAGLQAIGQLTGLRVLHLDGDISSKGIHHLRSLSELRNIELCEVNFGRDLSVLEGFPNCLRLNLENGQFANSALKSIESLSNLRILQLSDTDLNDDGMKYVAKLSRLHHLNIIYNEVTDDGMKYVAGLTELQELDCYNTPITADGFKYLNGLKRLRALALDRDAGISRDAIRKLREALPHVDVRDVTL